MADSATIRELNRPAADPPVSTYRPTHRNSGSFGAMLESVLDERGAGGVERREKLVRSFVDRWERGDSTAEREALKRVWPEKQHIQVGVAEAEDERADPPNIADVMAVLEEINAVPELPAVTLDAEVLPVDE